MSISPQTFERMELDFDTLHGHVVSGLANPMVSEDAKTLAAAIALAGSEIALAIAAAPERALGAGPAGGTSTGGA